MILQTKNIRGTTQRYPQSICAGFVLVFGFGFFQSAYYLDRFWDLGILENNGTKQEKLNQLNNCITVEYNKKKPVRTWKRLEYH